MKKALITILLIATLAAIATGCSAVQNADELSFDRLPKSVYEIGEDIGNFAVALKNGDNMTLLEYYKHKNDIKVEGFDTSEVGLHEARVTYAGQTITFSYTVKAAGDDEDFARGTGTSSDPYVISTENQFLHLNDVETAGKYYVLGDDIEIKTAAAQPYIITKPFEGVLSGGVLRRRIKVSKPDGSEDNCLFFRLQNATLKGFDVEFNGNSAITLAYCVGGENLINDVDAYGNLFFESNNGAIYLLYNFKMTDDFRVIGPAKTTFVNCDNHANVTSTSYIGLFTAFAGLKSYNVGSQSGYLTVRDCTNDGNICGSHVGLIAGNASSTYMYNITVENFTNNGVIGFTTYGGLIGGIGYNNTSSAYVSQIESEVYAVNVKNGDTGILRQFAQMTASIASDKSIKIIAPEGAKQVKAVIGYYGTLENGTVFIQGAENIDVSENEEYYTQKIRVLDVKPLSDEEVVTNGYPAITNLGEWPATEIDGVYYYIHSNTATSNSTLNSVLASNKLSVYVYAFDEDGLIIASKKVQ